MVGKTIENQTCADCGTEIRAAAMFCYHCGHAIEEVKKPEPQVLKKISKSSKRSSPLNVRNQVGVQTDETNLESDLFESNDSTSNGKGEIDLPTAASVRNRSRKPESKKIEIFWEEHENAPNVWFIVVALVFAVFTIAIFVLATYLK